MNKFIESDKVVMFSKTTCPFCMEAKDIIRDIYPDFKKFEINKLDDNTAYEIQEYLLELTGASTVPRIFINQKSIGGYQEIYQLQKTNQLRQLIQQQTHDD